MDALVASRKVKNQMEQDYKQQIADLEEQLEKTKR